MAGLAGAMTENQLFQQLHLTGANADVQPSRTHLPNEGKEQSPDDGILEELSLRSFDLAAVKEDDSGPRKKYFSTEDTLKSQSNMNESAAPLDMIALFCSFFYCLNTAYFDEPIENLTNYVKHLYAQVISGGKDFKGTVQEVEAFDPKDSKTWGTTIHNHGRIICFVFKGVPGSKNLRSFIDETSRLCCVSIKVFSAFVSLACVCLDKFPLEELPMAPLGANIIKTYKKEIARAQRWDIHFHTGFNFVASMKTQSLARLEVYKAKKAKVNKNEFAILSTVADEVPDFSIFVMVAFRMDSTRLERDVAIVGKNQSLKSLIQSTGMSLAFLSKIVERINLNDWDDSFKGNSEALAETVYQMLEQKTGLKKKKNISRASIQGKTGSSSSRASQKKTVNLEESDEEDEYDLTGTKEIKIN